jgi:hypothetical protein
MISISRDKIKMRWRKSGMISISRERRIYMRERKLRRYGKGKEIEDIRT